MQFLLSVIDDDPSTAPTHPATAADAREEPGVPSALDRFNEHLEAAGHWVFAGGLGTTENATVVDGRGGAPVVTDGPFLESKEHLGGLWIIEAADVAAALALAVEGSRSCNRKVEVRPFL